MELSETRRSETKRSKFRVIKFLFKILKKREGTVISAVTIPHFMLLVSAGDYNRLDERLSRIHNGFAFLVLSF